MQKMNVIVKDMQDQGTCEYTGKTGEVVFCSLDEQMPEVVLSTLEFFRQLRFMRLQREKKNGSAAQSRTPKVTREETK